MPTRAVLFTAGVVLGAGLALRAGAQEANFTFTDNVSIRSTFPVMAIDAEDLSGELSRSWLMFSTGAGFDFKDETSNTFPIVIAAPAPNFGLVIQSNGNVGTGTSSPAAAFHVFRSNGRAQLRVEDASTTVQSRNLVRLVNRGASTFRFDNTATNQAWGFGGLGSGNFFIGSTPGQLFALTLTPGGDLTVAGAVAQGSDRNSKQDVLALDAASVLERVVRLPLSAWEYKAAPGVRHVGPMAQDFAALFGLGADDTHIAPGDAAGVSLAAIQALKARNDRLRDQIAELATQVRLVCR